MISTFLHERMLNLYGAQKKIAIYNINIPIKIIAI